LDFKSNAFASFATPARPRHRLVGSAGPSRLDQERVFARDLCAGEPERTPPSRARGKKMEAAAGFEPAK
jgi:hypothetical protein